MHYFHDSGSLQWKLATPTGSKTPPARYGHSAVVYNKTLYILIGQDAETDYNDAWAIAMNGN